MAIDAILEGAMGDIEVLGNLLDGQDFIGLEGSLICEDSNLKLLFLCLGSLLFEESLSLSVRHCGEGDLADSWWASGADSIVCDLPYTPQKLTKKLQYKCIALIDLVTCIWWPAAVLALGGGPLPNPAWPIFSFLNSNRW